MEQTSIVGTLEAWPYYQQVALVLEKETLPSHPGISSGGEGSSGLYVRGGGPDQNLVLLDEAIVYNAAHLFGFFS